MARRASSGMRQQCRMRACVTSYDASVPRERRQTPSLRQAQMDRRGLGKFLVVARAVPSAHGTVTRYPRPRSSTCAISIARSSLRSTLTVAFGPWAGRLSRLSVSSILALLPKPSRVLARKCVCLRITRLRGAFARESLGPSSSHRRLSLACHSRIELMKQHGFCRLDFKRKPVYDYACLEVR